MTAGFINTLTSQPKKLFLIDGIGAFITAFSLVIILAPFEKSFGMPANVLYGLSLTACTYAIYSLCCWLFLKENWRPYLKAIAIANILYCTLTLVLIIFLYKNLTALGLLYFILELIIISLLISLELKATSFVNNK